MTQFVNAIFDHGVLRPLGPLELKDQEVVSLSVEKVVSPKGGPKLHEEPTFFDVLNDAGLIGCIKGAPADLSTNPKYMEGFGKSGN